MATNLTKTRLAKTTKEAKLGDLPATEKVDVFAKMALWSSANAAAVMAEFSKPFGDQDIGSLVTSLSGTMDVMLAGDMSRAEAMLYAQAHALQSIFMNLARRGANQEYLKQWEAYLRMALKAQNQCRMTLETLANIKNPPVVYARQANINNGGQQQVNNGSGSSRARETESEPNKLSGSDNELLTDAGAPAVAGRIDQEVEAVGKIDRTDDGNR